MTSKIIKPRFLPRGFIDGAATISFGFFMAVLLFVIPAAVVTFVSENVLAGAATFLALYVFFLLFTVKSLEISEQGIRFVRLLGSPKCIPWSEIRSVCPVGPMELLVKGWLWPPFPAKEMTVSHTLYGHYRISYGDRYAYFPPRDSLEFEALIPEHLMLRSNHSLQARRP